MTLGSLFSGCGGFDLGFERAGFETLFRCEIDPWCRRILTEKMPGPVVYGDVRGVGATVAPKVDVLIGGFPCQDVSVAGRGAGLEGDRSGLFFEFDRIIGELLPQWVVIENVPGLLSNRQGRDFATVLVHLAEHGYGLAWRVFNSRFFGVAQRRRRVFLVGCLGDTGERARAVLFEPQGVPWGAEARDEKRPDLAATPRGRSHSRGVNAPGRGGEDDENLVAYGVHLNQRGERRQSTLAGSVTASRSASEYRTYDHAGKNAGKTHNLISLDFSHTLTAAHTRSGRLDPNGETFIAVQREGGAGLGVRRLTPL